MNQHTLIGSDFHIGHNNHALLQGRGFNTIQEHDESFYNFCKKKKDKDLIFLGDLCLSGKDKVWKLIQLLSESFRTVTIVYGNHDRTIKKFARQLATHEFNCSIWKNVTFTQELTLEVDGIRVSLSHFPKQVWDKQRYGGIHIHGHCHAAIETSLPESSVHRALDAGYESIKAWAISWPNIIEIMNSKQILNT